MGLIEADFDKVFKDTEYLTAGIGELTKLGRENLIEQTEEISPFWKDAASEIFFSKQMRLLEDYYSETENLRSVLRDIISMSENLRMAERFGYNVGIGRNY